MNDHAYSDTLSGAQNVGATSPENSPLIVGSQYLQRLNIELQNTPTIFQDLPPHLHMGLIVDVTARQVSDAQNGFEVSLIMRAQGMKTPPTESDPNPPLVYDISMAYAGLFGFNTAVERNYAEKSLLVDAPHQLFPSARSVLLHVIREAGFPTTNIQPIDFDALWKSRRA